MNVPATTISVRGVNDDEVEELRTALRDAGADPASDLEVKSTGGADEDLHYEPITIAVIVLGHITMTALAIYLSKGRTSSKKTVHLRHRWPNGEEIEYVLEVDTSSEEATKADLLKQIAALKIPVPKGTN